MNVLLFPYYYYLSYAPFKCVIAELKTRGVNAKLVYWPDVSGNDESKSFTPQLFASDGVPYLDFRLLRLEWKKFRAFGVAIRLLQFMLNRRRIDVLLEKERPRVVIIGSHLGGVYIRVLQEICWKRKIQVVSLWTRKASLPESPEKKWADALFRLVGLDYAWTLIPFHPYNRRHLWVCTGEDLRENLLEIGIPRDLVCVTGNPLHDEVYQRRIRIRSQAEIVRRSLNIGNEEFLIVLLTENIHMVLGEQYLDEYLAGVVEALGDLPGKWKCVVKFHPRETEPIQSYFEKTLAGPHVAFVRDHDLFSLLGSADLAIASFSEALETAFFLGKPVVSINFTGQDKYSLFGAKSHPSVVDSKMALKRVLRSCVSDRDYLHQYLKRGEEWGRQNLHIDGKSSSRVVDAILSVVSRHDFNP